MSAAFSQALDDARRRVDVRIEHLTESLVVAPPVLSEAIRYVMLSGGKRLRPILCMWTYDAFATRDDESSSASIDLGVALECLHTYTLIHDDLPCMDDDDMRRGQPSCHKKYGEATAVLVGDALQALCFEIIATLGEKWGTAESKVVRLIRIVASAAGTKGLITGQFLDLSSESENLSVDAVENIHRHKTAALIAASMSAGAVLASDDESILERVSLAGSDAGLAFQIVDDLLDIETDGETLGKTPGKDVAAGKQTYPAVMSVEQSRVAAHKLIEQAWARLDVKGTRLGELIGFLVERRR